MYRTVIRVALAACIIFFSLCVEMSFAKNENLLVTINGFEYTDEDYKDWWSLWNDNKQLSVPSTPNDFVLFQLFSQQGQEMGYDTSPSYLHKIEVFLQVRSLMAFKYDEVDSKVNVTDADLKRYFEDNFATNWVLQVLSFDSEVKARKVYDAMLPFKGQLGGQLAFADWIGADPDEKADFYDEVTVCADDLIRNKKTDWLPIVKNLTVGDVSRPFLNHDNKKYLLIRLVEIRPAEEGLFEKKRQKMFDVLNKFKHDNLTLILIDELKKKYNLQIDRELLKSIKLDVDYPKDFLERKLVTMDGNVVTVGDLIFNIKKEKDVRSGAPDDILIEFVLNSIISQTLVNKESLARGYEQREPLKKIFDFYKKNRLRAEIESGLMNRIEVTDQDILNDYQINKTSYTIPEKLSFILIKGDEELLKKVWLGSLQGSDFNELAQKYSLEIYNQTRNIGDLSTVLLDQLKKIDKGGVSIPFALDKSFVIIKLLDRTNEKILPLVQVKDQIALNLKQERFEKEKAEYINKLKSKSKIEINERVWNGLVRELSNGK